MKKDQGINKNNKVNRSDKVKRKNSRNRKSRNTSEKSISDRLKSIPTFKIILYIILFIFLLIILKIYKFNNTNTNIDLFEGDISNDSEFVGVLDNRYYQVKDNKFNSYDKNNEVFSMNVLDVSNIVYDKYIYISEKSGRIKMIDRTDSKEVKRIDLDHDIELFNIINKKLVAFGEKNITVLDKKLEIVEEKEGLTNPVLYDFSNLKESLVEMDLINGKISSIFTVKNRDNTQFSISSINEVFLYTKIIDEDTILVSNRYIYLINGNSIIKKILLEDISAVDYKNNELVVVDNGYLKIFDNSLEIKENKNINMSAKTVSIRDNSIVILGEEKLSVYENGNVVDVNIEKPIDSYSDNQSFYIIFPGRIEKVNAY